ncbi:cytochrome-c oxidase, cbb3-type subunit III [Pseudoroseomonas rhizosphaerae]|uniref:Cbb3-type cytochrome c oxidase subunit n=1 Tax=Teichococcus rhizosphaerae TaxID=1335062 RepID=A0A2C7AC32_9PROT|nr:cytochrome-c oxidase, cbb3-type subunit III [Pseudoroseomonas rhizosphaerae]PHK94644.1 cytochrome-c oxidase, cbb3-type subunit III [Pseudoroseomonas rhizosphaerae]
MPTKIEKDAVSGRDTTGHEWDGIKELNTPLPRWWLYTFYATIVFALVWVVLYPALPIRGATGLTGWTARGAIVGEMAERANQQAPMLDALRAATPQQILADANLRGFALAGGRMAFANNCAGCHGAGGQGAPGGFPSLADDDWVWGGKLEEIRHTIRHGIRNTEDEAARATMMPRFLADGLLKPAQVNDVAEHVLSLSGRAADQAAAARGAAVFAENCASCHGEAGRGNREMGAPDLGDQVWLYGGDKAAVVHSIAYSRAGVMPSWNTRLDPAVVNMLTVYVHALGGGEAE